MFDWNNSYPVVYKMIFIGLGSSIGDAKKIFASAENAMRGEKINVLKKSKNMTCPPFGGVAKNAFTNAVWEIETDLSPVKLLEVLEKIEAEHGRIDKHLQQRWDDRTLDLDILIYNEQIVNTDKLEIPHPQMIHRDFVLKPLSELVDENFEIPTFGSLKVITRLQDNEITRNN